MNDILSVRYYILPLIIYLVISSSLVFVQKPDEDEALHTNASYNLAKYGFMGITIWDSRSEKRHRNWDKHFLSIPPAAIILEAFWFKIVGFGLFRLRFLSVLLGMAGLVSWMFILRKMRLKDKSVFLGLVLIAADFIYTRQSANGRLLDVMCAALSFASWASYLNLREKSLKTAVLVSNIFAMFSGLTHPNGFIGFIALVYLILTYDRKNLKLSHLFTALMPYFFGAAAWGAYVLPNWDDFKAQFFGIITDFGGESFGNPLVSVILEIKNKYLLAYGFSRDFPFFSRILLSVLLIYIAAFILMLKKIREDTGARAIFGILLINVLLFTFLMSHKYPLYLVHTIPLFAASLAFLWDGSVIGSIQRRLATLAVLWCIILSTAVNSYRIARNELFGKYIPEINEIKKIIPPDATVTAHCELAFFLGYEKLTDDFSLGYFSRKKTDFIIAGEIYRREFENYKGSAPQVYESIEYKLKNKYDLIYKGALYDVYRKRLYLHHAA